MQTLITAIFAVMVLIFVVAFYMTFVRDKSKDSTTWFYAGYALAAILLTISFSVNIGH